MLITEGTANYFCFFQSGNYQVNGLEIWIGPKHGYIIRNEVPTWHSRNASIPFAVWLEVESQMSQGDSPFRAHCTCGERA